MLVIELVAWLLVLVGATVAIAAVQCLQLYVRRRWQARVRLPDPVAYTDRPSFVCDDEIELRVHSSRPVVARFRRCGGDGFAEVFTIDAKTTLQEPRIDHWRGCRWSTSAVVPAGTLRPGFYEVQVEHRDAPARRWCMCLLVRPVIAEPIVVVAPTNTWNAYNDFGGLSNYRDRATPLPLRPIRALLRWCNLRPRMADRHWLLATPLPEARPNAYLHRELAHGIGPDTPDISGEAALIRFLERERAPYMVIADRDFAFALGPSARRLVMFSTHSEYWSDEMIARLYEMIERGINVAFLSGNSIYRKVQFMEAAVSVIDLMVPQEQVVPAIGTYSDAYGWRTYDAYRVVDADHWCFEGLGLSEGAEFGHGSARCPGASGRETDKIRPGAVGFKVLAVGKNSDGPAFMVCRDTPAGGFVFNVGSIAFTACLEDDPVIQRLVRNVIQRGIAAAAPGIAPAAMGGPPSRNGGRGAGAAPAMRRLANWSHPLRLRPVFRPASHRRLRCPVP